MSLKDDDRAAQASAKGPRVSLADIEAQIEQRFVINGGDLSAIHPMSLSASESMKRLTLAIVVLKNGFVFIGSSAAASPENYNRELAERLSYEWALRQIWSMMGFNLRDKIFAERQARIAEAEAEASDNKARIESQLQ